MDTGTSPIRPFGDRRRRGDAGKAHRKAAFHSSFVARHSSGAKSGFTLLEVMLAVALMALVLVSLLGLQSRSTQDVGLAEHITSATLLAKRLMTETLQSKPLGV